MAEITGIVETEQPPEVGTTPVPVRQPLPEAAPLPSLESPALDPAQAILGFERYRDQQRIEAFRQEHLSRPPAKPSPMSRDAIRAYITSEATRYGVDPALALASADVESGFNPQAVSRVGAKGVMQLMDPTAKRFGVRDSWNPEDNVTGGIKYMKFLQDLFPGRQDLQIAAYNAGEGAVKKYGGIPPFAETQSHVQKVMSRMGGMPSPTTASGAPAAATAPAPIQQPGTPPAGMAPDAAALSFRGVNKPAVLRAPTAAEVLPPSRPWVDVAIEAPGFIAANARSLVSGAFRAIGNLGQVPGSLAEIAAPMLPEAVKDVIGDVPLGGIPLNVMAEIWQGIGTAAEQVAQQAEVPAVHKTFFNKLFEGAGAMTAYWAPAIASGGGILLPTAMEAFAESQEVYAGLKTLVGQDEAAKRAGVALGANVLVLGISNRLGIGNQAKTMLGKVAGAVIGESVLQELPQYEIQRRQFWVPVGHPAAERLKAGHGWVEADGRVSQPFDPKTAAEVVAIGAILGGGMGFVRGMKFGLQPPAVVAEQTAQIQALDTQDVSAQIPDSVVRADYGTLPSTPELALPGSAVRGPAGELARVYHGALESFKKFDMARAGTGAGGDLWGPGLYHAEDPQVAGERYAQGERPRMATRIEDIRHIFTPGAIVPSYGGQDRVLSFQEDGPFDWSVTVQAVDQRGDLLPGSRPRSHSTAPTLPPAPNVRPAYLDIRKPFDTTALFPIDRVQQIFDAVDIETMPTAMLGGELYRTLVRAMPHPRDVEGAEDQKLQVNEILQRLGYDGIFHIGQQDGRVWIAFRPEQVIPAFDVDAMLQLAQEEAMAAPETPPQAETPPALPATPAQTRRRTNPLLRWQGYILSQQGQRGMVPLPGGSDASLPPATERLAEIDALIADYQAMGETPSAALLGARAELAAEIAATPPPLPPPGASPLAEARDADPSELATALAEQQRRNTLRLRDDQGRWRIPLKRIPSTELELADFIVQKGGMQLEGETDVPGELRALVSRQETGRWRLQNNRSGQTLQGMAELAEQHGFIATADKTALLEAMDRSIRQGQPVYSQNATGHVPGLTDTDAVIDLTAPRPLRPAPPLTEGGQARRVLVLSDAQIRMHDRATSLSNFLVDDRVEFRTPNGQQHVGRVTAVDGTRVTVQSGRTQTTVDVLSEDMRTVRLMLTKAQREAEQAGIIDLPTILSSQIDAILAKPEGDVSGRVLGINYDHLQTDTSVKSLWRDMVNASQVYIQEARRGTITRQELLAMAQDNIAKKRFTIDTLLQRAPGQTFSPEDVVAARMMGVSMAEELAVRVKAFQDSPSPDTQDALLKFFPLAVKVAAQWSGLAAEMGRGLNAFTVGVTGELNYVEEVGDRLSSVPMNVTMEEFAEHLSGLKTREEFLATLVKVPTWGELFLAGLYGVKLMQFTSDAANILGASAATLWTVGVRQVAGLTPGSGVPVGEATAMLKGWFDANLMMLRLWNDLSDVRWTQRPRAMMQEVAGRIGFDDIFERVKTEGLSGAQTITAANIQARGALSGPVGRVAASAMAGGPARAWLADHVGALLHFSGAKLNFEDLIAKTYNYVAEGYAQGYRAAMEEETPLHGEDLWNFVQDYAMNMKGTVKEKAKALAFENTLTEKLGPVAAHLEGALNALPVARIVILFYRTPMNGARWVMRNGPLGIFAQKNQEMLRAGGPDAAIATARIGLGSVFMLMGGLYALMGLAKGKHPGNDEARKLITEDGKIPEYSAYVPFLGRYATYNRAEPVAGTLGMGADLGSLVLQGKFTDLDGAELLQAAGGAVAMTIANNVLERTWMQGANDIFRLLLPPKSTSEEARGKAFERYFARQVTGMVPPPVRWLRRQVDPMARQTQDLLDALMDATPFLSKDLPPAHNWLGYVRRNPDALGPDFVSPVIAPPHTPKLIFSELERLISQGYLTMPDRPRRLKAGDDTIDLSAEEVSRLELMIAGGEPDKTGEPGKLEVALEKFMNSDRYKDVLTDFGRAETIEKALRAQMAEARGEFLRDMPRVRAEVEQGRREAQERQYQRPQVGQ